MNERFYIDLHVIQSVPPCCINRDDTGSPKTAKYGGVTRARVSSQAWKHEMRVLLPQFVKENSLAFRTKWIVACVADQIKKLDSAITDEKAEDMAKKALELAGLKIKSAEKGTDALFFLSQKQAQELAALSVNKEQGKAYYNALNKDPSVDMVLFGRMVASDPSLNYDAAAQVAHSISTHEVHNEFDYFTAIDDYKEEYNEKDNGAAHIGTMEFNSSTLYRYATVNVTELYNHLAENAAEAVRGFTEAFIRSMPTGKQNSFANRTFPDMIYVAIRRDQPINLVGAFEEPVRSSNGYVKKSIQSFCDYAKDVYEKFDAEPETAFVIGNGTEKLVSEQTTLKALLNEVENMVKNIYFKGEE